MEMKENKQTESGCKIKIEDCVSENILENLYITSNKSNYDWLMESKYQLAKGKCVTHDLLDESADK